MLHTSVAGSEGELIADDGRASIGCQLLRVEVHVWHARSILVPAASLQNKTPDCIQLKATRCHGNNDAMMPCQHSLVPNDAKALVVRSSRIELEARNTRCNVAG